MEMCAQRVWVSLGDWREPEVGAGPGAQTAEAYTLVATSHKWVSEHWKCSLCVQLRNRTANVLNFH